MQAIKANLRACREQLRHRLFVEHDELGQSAFHWLAQTWTGVTMVGELDVLELRDATGRTIARGRRDTTPAEV